MFGYGYRIEPDAVTLRRNTWLAVPSVVMLAGGVILMARVNGAFGMVYGFVGAALILGGAALGVSALAPPWRVIATADGLRWGRTWIAAAEIRSIEATIKEIRIKGDRVQYAALIVKCDGIPDRELRLQNGEVKNLCAEAIANAMADLCKLSSRKAK